MSILDGELADTIADALADADIPIDVTVTREEEIGPGENPWDPPITGPVNYSCKGFVDTFGEFYAAAGLVEAGDAKIVIVAKTLSIVPAIGNTVTARSKTWMILNVSADPALALYELHGRA